MSEDPISEDEVKQVVGVKGLDFSEFHPLDHHALSVRCARYPGGFRRHVVLWLTYQWKWPWEVAFDAIRCRSGRHDRTPYWRGIPRPGETGRPDPNLAEGYLCLRCFARWDKDGIEIESATELE